MNEVKKCPKCGSTGMKKKSVKLADPTVGFFSPLIATSYTCNSCGYIEFYRE